MEVFKDKMQWYKFVKILLSWLGTPHKHLQYEKKVGADCALFLAACLKEFGVIKNITFETIPQFWHMITEENEVILNHILLYIKENFHDRFTLKKVDKLMRGDIITFNLRSKVSNHIGLYFGNGLMINSVNNRGVCIIPVFTNRITNIYRIYKK